MKHTNLIIIASLLAVVGKAQAGDLPGHPGP